MERARAARVVSLEEHLLQSCYLAGGDRDAGRRVSSVDGWSLACDSTLDGKVLWEFNTAAEPYVTVAGKQAYGGVMDGAGPMIAGGILYVHSGYAGRSTGRGQDLRGLEGNVLVAFSVDGK